MPIVIVHESWGDRPAVMCDVCQQEVQDGKRGAYAWYQSCRVSPLITVHKACLNSLDERLGYRAPWMELKALPAYLASNIGVTLEDSQGSAAALSVERWSYDGRPPKITLIESLK